VTNKFDNGKYTDMVIVLNNGQRAVKMFDTVPYFSDTADCLICEDVRIDTAILIRSLTTSKVVFPSTFFYC